MLTTEEKKFRRNAYLAKWRETKREDIRAQARAWRERHPDKVRQKSHAAYWADPGARKAYGKLWRAKNKARMKILTTKWKTENRELINERQRRKYEADPKRHREYVRVWRLRHHAKVLEKEKLWRQKNKPASRRQCQQRQARKDHQLHPKNDPVKELELYRRAEEIMRGTGQAYHVDHIIPLACGGWHHHENLQVLPAKINGEKANNPFWEMDGYKSWRDVPEELWPENLVEEYRKRC